MRRIFAIWAVCLCWGILNAAPLGPFNATILEQLKNDYQKGDKDVVRYIEFQEKAAEKYIKMTPLSDKSCLAIRSLLFINDNHLE